MQNKSAKQVTTTVVYHRGGVDYSATFRGIVSRSEAERQVLFTRRIHVPARAFKSITVNR